MKIVLLYNDSDCCTYSCDVVKPIEHDSIESAYVEFDEALTKAGNGLFRVFGIEFVGYKFSDGYRPQLMTVDEWYEKYLRA